jgi:hypothetical protein
MFELLKRYWMVLAAGAISIWTAYALINPAIHLERSYERQANTDTAYYAEKAQSEYAWDCLHAPSPARDKCRYEKAQSARNGQHSANDLEAQSVTAVWTRQMGFAAIIGVAVSIVGVILVWITFRATREGNEIAGDTAHRQLRAYIAPLEATGHIWWEKEQPGVAGSTGYQVKYSLLGGIKNVGQTPATISKQQLLTDLGRGGAGWSTWKHKILAPTATLSLRLGGSVYDISNSPEAVCVKVTFLFCYIDYLGQARTEALWWHSDAVIAKAGKQRLKFTLTEHTNGPTDDIKWGPGLEDKPQEEA